MELRAALLCGSALISGFACGRIGYGADRDAAAPPDAAPFGAPVRIAELYAPDANDEDPTLTADLLEIYFESDRPGGLGRGDIWVARRAAVDDPWGTPEPVIELSSDANDTDPEVSADGLTMWLASDRLAAGDHAFWVSRRSSRTAPWPAPERVVELDTAGEDDYAPSPSADELTLVYAREAAAHQDLFVSRRSTPDETWPAGVRLAGPNTALDDAQPHLTGEAGHLIFASDRPRGLGQLDLYLASSDGAGDFASVDHLVELSSSGYDGGPWMTDDLRYVVFDSDRDGTLDLYEARR